MYFDIHVYVHRESSEIEAANLHWFQISDFTRSQIVEQISRK